MIRIMKQFPKSHPSHMVAMLSIDTTNNDAFLWREDWDDVQRIPMNAALSLSTRWPRLQRFNTVTVDASPYFASQVA